MKSLLLQELARLILPFAMMFGLALLLKGHDAPGGGFVSGLSFAVAGVLGFTAYGVRRFHGTLPVEPERVALLGGVVVLLSALGPMLLGDPALTQANGVIALGPLYYKWQSALLFDIGVVMVVGGGFSASALFLWETRASSGEDA